MQKMNLRVILAFRPVLVESFMVLFSRLPCYIEMKWNWMKHSLLIESFILHFHKFHDSWRVGNHPHETHFFSLLLKLLPHHKKTFMWQLIKYKWNSDETPTKIGLKLREVSSWSLNLESLSFPLNFVWAGSHIHPNKYGYMPLYRDKNLIAWNNRLAEVIYKIVRTHKLHE
jgi:hypothetical protein